MVAAQRQMLHFPPLQILRSSLSVFLCYARLQTITPCRPPSVHTIATKLTPVHARGQEGWGGRQQVQKTERWTYRARRGGGRRTDGETLVVSEYNNIYIVVPRLFLVQFADAACPSLCPRVAFVHFTPVFARDTPLCSLSSPCKRCSKSRASAADKGESETHVCSRTRGSL